MKTWKKICVGSAIGITIGGSIYCGNKLMSDKPVEASTIIETATDAVADTIEDVVVAAETTEEPKPEIAEDDKKDNSKSDDKKNDSKVDDKKDDSKVDDKKDVGSDSGTENVVSNKEPAANVESTKPAPEAPKPEKPAPEAPKPEKPAPEAPKPTKPATTEAPKPEKPATTEAPKHQHDYSVWVVDVPASTKTVVDKEAWTETVEHPEEGYNTRGYRCSYCGQVFASGAEADAHAMAYVETDRYHFAAGWGSANYWVKTKDAWTETINHPAETHEETVPEQGHWECSCGARK